MPEERCLLLMWLVKSFAGILFLLQNAGPALSAKNVEKTADPRPAVSAQKANTGQKTSSPAQENAAAPSGSATPSGSAVAPSVPVITIPGLCDESAASVPGKQAGACRTVITRGDFEKLMNALNPEGQPVSQSGRQNLAQAYVEALAFAGAAQKAGMDRNEAFREVLYWARLRTMADLYRRKLQEDYRNPSAEEIDSYYQQHRASFERVRLLRVLVPREDFAGGDKSEFEKKALAAAQAAHARAQNGDDFEQIQKDVYAGLGLERAPGVNIGSFHRGDLMENEAAEVFSLKPGEISRLQVELKSYVIYKVAAHETPTKAEVSAEITHQIAQQKFRDALKAVMDSAPAEFNQEYFGAMPAKPALEPPAVPRRGR